MYIVKRITMSEHTQPSYHQSESLSGLPGEALQQSSQAFQEQLQYQCQLVPEIADKSEAISQAGEQLIADYQIQPALFESPERSLVFTMISERAATHQTDQGEADFVKGATTLLADRYSPILDIAEISSKISPEVEHAVYEKYTDRELTNRLSEAVENGLLDNVKQRMGITADNEDYYEVRVLNADPEGMNSIGLAPGFSDWDDIPGDIHEKQRVAEEESARYDAYLRRVRELAENAQAIEAELSAESLPQAFVADMGPEDEQVRNLCIMAPLAEKLLAPEKITAEYYTEDYAVADRALLEHEYVHTQGGLHLDNDTKFGINLEEVRAEHYSGNHQGYQDAKGFFNDMLVISGTDVVKPFESEPKGGTAMETYTMLAKEFGLRTALEVLMAAPKNYLESGPYRQATFEHIGGYDGVLGRILDSKVAAGESLAVENRITRKAQMLLEMVDNRAFVINYYKKLGLNVVADLLESRMQEIEAKQATER
jgi:hypothetical protein